MYCRTCEDYYKRIGRTKNNLLKHMVRRGQGQGQGQGQVHIIINIHILFIFI